MKKGKGLYVKLVAWDKDTLSSDDLIGMRTVNITEFMERGQAHDGVAIWTDIIIEIREGPGERDTKTGDIKIRLLYEPQRTRITISVLEANDLVSPDTAPVASFPTGVWVSVSSLLMYL